MDIKNVNNNVVTNRSNESVKPSSKDTTGANSNDAPVQADKVTLTQAISQVSNLEQTARSVNTDNSARIAEIKSAIQDGSYKVDAEKVADKLMQTEALFARF